MDPNIGKLKKKKKAANRARVMHGPIIKWTQHIGFLSLAGMA